MNILKPWGKGLIFGIVFVTLTTASAQLVLPDFENEENPEDEDIRIDVPGPGDSGQGLHADETKPGKKKKKGKKKQEATVDLWDVEDDIEMPALLPPTQNRKLKEKEAHLRKIYFFDPVGIQANLQHGKGAGRKLLLRNRTFLLQTNTGRIPVILNRVARLTIYPSGKVSVLFQDGDQTSGQAKGTFRLHSPEGEAIALPQNLTIVLHVQKTIRTP